MTTANTVTYSASSNKFAEKNENMIDPLKVKGSVIAIDWKSVTRDSSNCNSFHKLKTNAHSQFITLHIKFISLLNMRNRRRSVLDIISNMYSNIKLLYTCNDHASSYNLTRPCHAISFSSWEPSSHHWRIHVHMSLMINITIVKAYILFSDLCHPHNIGVFEGHAGDNQTRIDYFCGLVKLESV